MDGYVDSGVSVEREGKVTFQALQQNSLYHTFTASQASQTHRREPPWGQRLSAGTESYKAAVQIGQAVRQSDSQPISKPMSLQVNKGRQLGRVRK